MKFLIASLLLVSTSAHAGSYTLKCSGPGYNGKTDSFRTVIDTDRKLVFIETASDKYPFIKIGGNESTDLGSIDPKFFDAEFSASLSAVTVEVSTYSYFNGDISMNFGKDLKDLTKDIDFSIGGNNSVQADVAVEYDDGDGFGFNKRTYSCEITPY